MSRAPLTGILAWFSSVMFVLSNCSLATPYVPDARLNAATGATLHLPKRHAGLFSGSTKIDVYTFDSGCPDISTRLTSRGYRGSASLDGNGFGRILIPADKPIVLKLDWTSIYPGGSETCASALMYRPDSGSEYMIGYVSPAQGATTCSVALRELVEGENGATETDYVEDVVRLDLRFGWNGLESKRLCAGLHSGALRSP